MNANLLALAAVPHAGLVQLADLDENKVTPGLLGFIVFALIGGATWLLMKNMNKQLKKIDVEPASKASAPAPSAAAPTPSAAGEAPRKVSGPGEGTE